ncbi:unnamed protein product [Acanthoscelides obtectus]|uniref:PiggyBac transposable element-derived protein domain-containing protein n=1 Tax=Acanthoscelides obtectus TaxID=200917 RepID=A0A9P0PRE4_ACAOB|nr:unnamed protein product [Acanthoscelides obtectus]CAK1672266.1 PiggyBac transposable element-derived protein 1 [Acanthoscelides obtectus]
MGVDHWREITFCENVPAPPRVMDPKKFYGMECPGSVFVYNNYMGGVDLLDAMLGLYRIRIRSKKWYLRIFFHMLDMCCVNAWLLWRRSNKEFDLPLKDFKLAIADSLCNLNREHKRRVGRPSAEVQTLYAMKKKRGPTKEIPQQEVAAMIPKIHH